MEMMLPNNAPALCLDWKNGNVGILLGAKSLLYLFRQDRNGDFDDDAARLTKFDVKYDVHDVASRGSGSPVIFGACDDCKVRVWDVETQKLVGEMTDHKMPLEVCKAK